MSTRIGRPMHVYFLRSERSGRIKIGASADPAMRAAEIRRNAGPVTLLGTVPEGGKQLERELHRRFDNDSAIGEWFDPTPALLSYIAEHAWPYDGNEAKRVVLDTPITALRIRPMYATRRSRPRRIRSEIIAALAAAGILTLRDAKEAGREAIAALPFVGPQTADRLMALAEQAA